LPTPGPLAADVDAAVPAGALELVVLELLDDDLLLLPHAASPTLSAANANIAAALPPRVLNLLHRLPVIRRLLIVYFVDRKS
jgi:hypothetical protein